MTAKHSVNLLHAELYPEKQLLTLTSVATAWLVLLAFMGIWTAFTEMNFKQSAEKHNGLLKQQQQKSILAKQLESQLQTRKISPALKKNLNTIKLVMQHKDALLNKLTDSNETFAGGFVMAMNDLSAMHHKDIRLQTIRINAKEMSFTGLARTPQAVPAWLAGFKNSRLLSGKAFVHFKLVKNEQNITEFVVSSAPTEGES
ncbi:PilN domain-containing protein [Colwellia psychrerythraea]|uniref:Fimbrial assembly family protein n=1 Tax=Colwellia psychrerythraea TaxID=28229 RepID=A0A099KPD7_COLPS|nr:PilN domain-containing protein [Colwellia psychrerythraea]KGJ92376.1 Fimbrial assembly family protein [Colwellia psychrerythraea]